MAYIESWTKQEMTKPVKVNYLSGNLFSQDSQGNLLGVELYKDGEAYSGGGTVSGTVIRADGGTVAVDTGSITGNKAQIILPAAAYAVVGAVTIIIKLTQGGQTATVGAFVSMVYATSTDTIVDPGTVIPSIADLIAQIQAAVGSVPADYSALNQEVNDLKTALEYEIDSLTENQAPDLINIIDWKKIKHKTLMWDAGIYRENAGYWCTDYMSVKPNTTYVKYNPVKNTEPGTQRTWFFDGGKNSVGLGVWNEGPITTPSNAAYMVISARYVHEGSLGEYNSTPDWDDNIERMYINIGTTETRHAPYPSYLTDDIKVRHNVNSTGRVVYIDDAIDDDSAGVIISRSAFGANTTIQIVICGRNIFDRELQEGYWSGNSVISNSSYRASVNPIYVNGGDVLYFAQNCRVTEFNNAGEYTTSYLAVARQPYKVSLDTNYIHISSETGRMEQMYVYVGSIPDTNVNYQSKIISHTVRNWGTTLYEVPVSLYEGYNTVYIKKLNSPNITVEYNVDISVINKAIRTNKGGIFALNDYKGTKLAQNEMFVAHRGSTIEAPENTMPAIVTAFLNGYKSIEIDVRFTSDNVPVLLHDATIDRTSNGTGSVNSFTYEQLQTYDFGSWFSPKFRNVRIPSLQNALSILSKFNATPHLDLAGSTLTEAQLTTICNLLFRFRLEEKAIWLLNPSGSGIATIKAFYTAKGKKFKSMWQVSTFPEDSVITLLNNINSNFRNDVSVEDMGISINISALTANIRNTALSFARPIPIGVYFIDDYNSFTNVHSYPFLFITTNRLDLPMNWAHYYAPSIDI